MPDTIKELSGRIMQLAKARRVTLATVESCTAGSLAHLLSQAEGASDTAAWRICCLHERQQDGRGRRAELLLRAHTAVSAEVATAMAKGGLSRCPADVVVAITGVAGPEPDEDGNPVGLVYVAVAARDGRTQAERHEFGKRDRNEICSAAMAASLKLAQKMLEATVP